MKDGTGREAPERGMMADGKRNGDGNSQMTWIRGGAALSLGWLALALYRRRWRSARVGFAIAASFLEKWGELRLHEKVARLLEKNEEWDGVGDPPFNPVDSWRTA
jgi:hypothetical protein